MCDAQTGKVVAEAHTVPCWWDGTMTGLPDGIDATIADAFHRLETGQPFNALCAIAAEIPKGGRGTGLAAEILKGAWGRSPPDTGSSTNRAGPADVEGPLPDHTD